MTLNLERARVKFHLRNLLSKITRKLNTATLNRLASVALLLAIFPATFISFTNTAVDREIAGTQIKLSLNSPAALALDSTKPNIVPGESKTNQEARVAAEAEAKRLADAKALAQSKITARNTVSREYRVYTDPSNFDEIYARAGNAYGVDPSILKAIHIVETGASGSTSRANPSGATGPMQFIYSTWKRHAVDGNGDGSADISNVEDAIFTAAAYLKACGYPNVKKALWGYNPSTSYFNKVIGIARSFGFNG